ncbi:hypothetical protein ABIC49_004475 [Burkholderia ambifaria]
MFAMAAKPYLVEYSEIRFHLLWPTLKRVCLGLNLEPAKLSVCVNQVRSTSLVDNAQLIDKDVAG